MVSSGSSVAWKRQNGSYNRTAMQQKSASREHAGNNDQISSMKLSSHAPPIINITRRTSYSHMTRMKRAWPEFRKSGFL